MNRLGKLTSALRLQWRTLTGASLLLVRCRARRDLALLITWTALAAIASLLAVGGPQLMLHTVDAGAREAVAAGGVRTDVLVGTKVGVQRPSDLVNVVRPDDIVAVASKIERKLPRAIRQVEAGTSVAVLGPTTDVAAENTAPQVPVTRLQVRMAMVTPANLKDLAVVRGQLPSAAGTDAGSVDAVISTQAAAASSLDVGSVVTVRDLASGANTPPLVVRVVGIVKQGDAPVRPSPWTDVPGLWNATATAIGSVPLPSVTMLAQPSGVSAAAEYYSEPFDATLRVRLDPASFSKALEHRVGSEIDAIKANNSSLQPSTSISLGVQSSYASAMAAYSSEARAATAQMSVLLIGVLGVVLAVLILLSRLLVLRRTGELTLERSRGASLASGVVRFAMESVIAGVIAVAIGVGLASLLLPESVREPLILVAVILFALLSAPVQAVFLVRGLRIARGSATQRRDLIDSARRRAARRLTVEALVLALSVAAVVSLESRGLLQTSTAGIDPLLSAAPLLVAAAITLVVLRVYRWPVRLVGALGRRTRGPLGLLGAVRAQNSIAVLPLLALTLAVALATGSALIADTVRDGQVDASWQRIGADLRADGPVASAQVSRIAESPGVTAAASYRVVDDVHLDLKTATSLVTLIAVDHRYSAVLDALPDTPGVARPMKKGTMASLTQSADRLPVIVDPELAARLPAKDLVISVGEQNIRVRVVGTSGSGAEGYLDGPFMYVDLAALSSQLPAPIAANTMLVVGSGAQAAVTAELPRSTVHTRTGWIKSWRGKAMVSGVQQTLSLSAGALAVLAMIAMLASVVAGARERARSLSLLRTLGMPVGLGWWLALAELTPLVVAAVAGGVAAGVTVVLLLGPPLGLGVLAGGLFTPVPTVSWLFIAGLLALSVVLLGVTVLVEVLMRRRDRVSEVLRVGETV